MKTILFLNLIFMTFLASAGEYYQGIRQMSMGGAAVAVVNDETSLLLNPNGLGRLRGTITTFIDPEVTTNTQSLNAVNHVGILSGSNISNVYSQLASTPDQRYFYREQFFPSFVMRNFGIGLLKKNEILATRLSSNQNLQMTYADDWAAVLGYNHNFFGGVLKLGGTLKFIDRVGYDGLLDPSTQGLNIDNFAQAGLAVGGDVGVTLTSPTSLLPTFSVVAKDIGDTSFGFSKSLRGYKNAPVPAKINKTINAGMAFFPIHTNSSRSTFTVQYDDLVNTGDFVRKFHGGYEINLADKFFIRLGYNKGYFTSGIEWSTRNTQLQLAYYGENVGTVTQPILDKRVSAKFVLRF